MTSDSNPNITEERIVAAQRAVADVRGVDWMVDPDAVIRRAVEAALAGCTVIPPDEERS